MRHGLEIEIAEPRDLPRLEANRIPLVLDWDFLPEDYRSKLLDGPSVKVVGIHGYGLGDSLAPFLARRGIVCRTMLDQHFIQALMGKGNAA